MLSGLRAGPAGGAAASVPAVRTHNALAVASLIEDAGGIEEYEFSVCMAWARRCTTRSLPSARRVCRVYAPVGGHRDLLAYLVRRLLENGANSSFVSVAADARVPVEQILERPQARIGDQNHPRNPNIPLPRDLFRPLRKNSAGVEFGDPADLARLLADVAAADIGRARAAPLIDGIAVEGRHRPLRSPIDAINSIDDVSLGEVIEGDEAIVGSAMAAAQAAFVAWSATPVAERAAALDRAADLIEADRGAMIALLQAEGGKTIDDAVSEVREAAD